MDNRSDMEDAKNNDYLKLPEKYLFEIKYQRKQENFYITYLFKYHISIFIVSIIYHCPDRESQVNTYIGINYLTKFYR